MIPQIPFLTTLLALAGIFLGLSVLAQVFQEVYKFLTSSKARAYQKALIDFLGPWVTQLFQTEGVADLQIRGPFQLLKLKPSNKLLPMSDEGLSSALEKTIPDWHQKALDHLKLEAKLQKQKPKAPSHEWNRFLSELAGAEKEMPGYWDARDIYDFLKTWNHKPQAGSTPNSSTENEDGQLAPLAPPDKLDAEELLVVFRKKFLPAIEQAKEQYDQFMSNFQYTYRRRNLRQTFIIGFVVALLFNLPFQTIYKHASQLSLEDAVALADRTMALYSSYQEMPPDTSAQGQANLANQVKTLNKKLQTRVKEIEKAMGNEAFTTFIDQKTLSKLWANKWSDLPKFLFGCIITALLLSFGAPFWNDLAGALLRIQGNRAAGTSKETKGGQDVS